MIPAAPVIDAPDSPVLHGFPVDVVQARLAAFLADKSRRLGAVSPELEELASAAVVAVAGGKRLRPAFLYWGWRAACGSADVAADEPAVLTAAAALELLQGSALTHDDVMDGSELRRGRPSAHTAFDALHRERRCTGSPQRFGAGAAILLGDLLLNWSGELFRLCNLPTARLLPAVQIFDDMRSEVICGQYLDLVEQATSDGSVERAMLVVRYKAAKYTVERPLHLGAVLGGGSPDLLRDLSAYGTPLGEAFQLRDDVLGLFGDPAVTGKPAGEDIREGKRTVLLAEALATATRGQAAALGGQLGNPDLTPDGLALVRQVVTDTGGLARVERRIELLAHASRRGLQALDLPDHATRAALSDLISTATRRLL